MTEKNKDIDGSAVGGLPLLQRYRFHIETSTPVLLPQYTGSMWRGLFGHGLRKAACATRQSRCDGCLLLESCMYNRVFETRVDDPPDPRYRNRPHPFVLEIAPSADHPVTRFSFGMTLFDNVREALPYIVYAVSVAGKLGLGRDKTPYELLRVETERTLGSDQWHQVWTPETALDQPRATIPECPQAPDSLTVTLQTPLRIKQHGKLLKPGVFNASVFLTQLWRRAANISHFHGGSFPADLPEDKPENIVSKDVRLHWHDWRRYSSRQKTAMNMGGVVGEFTLEGEDLAQWWPLIWYGQWLHLGKATSMGLGRYRVSAA